MLHRPEPAARHAAETERRNLTVMFCDLVASTTLAERIDDEDLREVIRRYYDACADSVGRYDGHVANYLGDGLLLYFGYPRAHEDDAERAVRAALDMLGKLERDFGALNATLEAEQGLRLSVRIGIHTGPVVIGDLGGGQGREGLALGETMNLAARLQSVAAPDTVVISGTTRRLVRGIFVLEEMGPQRLKGIGEPVPAYRVLQPSGVRSRLDVAEGSLTPFVGRHAELEVLLECWERIQERDGQTVLISGEAGVGKSRLVQQFRERLADQAHTWLECRCSPYAQHSAFYPVIELVQQGLAFQAADTTEEKVAKLEQALQLAGFSLRETMPLFADFLSIPLTDAYQPLQLSPELQRRRTLEALAAWNLALSELQAVLVLIEDLHWCDPSSLELFGRLIEQSPTTRVMLLCTARPEFQSPWPVRSNLTPLHLSRLTRRQARDMVLALSVGREAVPSDVTEAIVTRADGIPLYIEELAKAVLESGASRDVEAIPATLQDSLMARLDRLSAAKEVAQRAAVLGREFPYALLAATVRIKQAALREGLARLVEAELLFARGEPPEATYTFKHALIQKAAYESLLKRTRRELHGRVARVLEERFPARAAAEPEVVARHYEAAGLVELAVAHYQRAGDQAVGRSAHEEALVHFRKGITLLGTLPERAERDAREVPLQLALGVSLIAVRGYSHPETEAAYERARVVCDAVGDVVQRASALYGLSNFYTTRGEPGRGLELAERILQLGRRTGEEVPAILGHLGIAIPELCQGKFASALAHCEEASAIYDPSRHRVLAFLPGADQGIAARCLAAWSLWFLGYPDRALEREREALEMAAALAQPFSLGYALFFETQLHCVRRDVESQRELADRVITLSEAHGFPLWLGLGKAHRGAALAASGGGAIGIRDVLEGLSLSAGTGLQAFAPAQMGLLAETYQVAGQYIDALGVVEAALSVSAETGQCLWDAELHRLKGELLLRLQAESEAEAERLFGRALEIARAQDARGLELRAAASLARLLGAQARRGEARSVLAPVYRWFTEGFDTGDLREAKALLDELG